MAADMNRSVEGFAFEYVVLHVARTRKRLSLTIEGKKKSSVFEAEDWLPFKDVSDILVAGKVTTTVFLVPQRFNQGAYDLIHLYFDGAKAFLTFFQVTLQKSHKLKCSYLTTMMEHLCGKDAVAAFKGQSPMQLKKGVTVFGNKVDSLHTQVVSIGPRTAPDLVPNVAHFAKLCTGGVFNASKL